MTLDKKMITNIYNKSIKYKIMIDRFKQNFMKLNFFSIFDDNKYVVIMIEFSF